MHRLSCQMMASHMDNNYNEFLAGISVICDVGSFERCSTSASNNCGATTVTGTVRVNTNETVSYLRLLLRRELPALPTDFNFLTKQSWPVKEEQESEIKIEQLVNDKSIITICRHFAQPRVGVRNASKEVVGFIFIDYNRSLPELRQALREQLTFLSPELMLVDSKGWPVHPSQEKDMVTWDLLSEGCITIRGSIPENISLYHSNPSIDVPDSQGRKRRPSGWNGSVHPSMGEKSFSEQENGDQPTILISYVRGEAAKHAKDLKWQLTDKGYSVFLDVDEIRGGRDWQDALNSAVHGCSLFIPLITPQYGQTRWTNREVKLADQLQKLIIPINFLTTWPPPCLAIQFTSLHFLPWKTASEIEQEKQEFTETRATDIRFWDEMYVKRIVDSIIDRYEEYCKETEVLSLADEFSLPQESDCSPMKKSRSQLSLPLNLPDIEFEKPIEPKPLIVISAHPNDEECIQNIRTMLSAHNYDVWSSADNLDEFEALGSQGSISHLASPMTPLAPSFPDTLPLQFSTNSQESTCSELSYHTVPKRRPSLQLSNFRQSSFYRSDSVLTLSPVSMDKLRVFRNRALKAGVVIILLSEDYCNAKTSKKQVYYCEQRKPIIPIQISNFRVPTYITNFFGNSILQYSDSAKFLDDLINHVKASENASSPGQVRISPSEIHLQAEVLNLKKAIKNPNCIYVIGSTRMCNARTKDICCAIGQELAICNLTLATSGFYGVGENVGRSFCEEQDLNGQKPALLFNILPKKDDKDFSKVSRQNRNGVFQRLTYGQTIFIGESVAERDEIVARTFNVCLLIEGNSESAQEAERFVWNDNIVIPIISTGGAAAGDYGSRTWDVPPGVSEKDWALLSKKDEPGEVIAEAVKRILVSLRSKEVTTSETGNTTRSKRIATKSSQL